MTAYETDNLPENLDYIKPLPDELFQKGYEAIKDALENSGGVLASEIKVAYAYERKGELSLDQFGGKRNVSYASDSDDIILQLTVRIDSPNVHWKATDAGSLVGALEDEVKELDRKRKIKVLEAEIAAEEARAEAAARAVRQKRAELGNLRK